jgi:hypothetical protein
MNSRCDVVILGANARTVMVAFGEHLASFGIRYPKLARVRVGEGHLSTFGTACPQLAVLAFKRGRACDSSPHPRMDHDETLAAGLGTTCLSI